MSNLDTLIADSRSRADGYRQSAALAVKGSSISSPAQAFDGGGGSGGAGSILGEHQRELSQHAVQLRSMRGWVYAAIRPIATRIAGQEIRVGVKKATATPAGQMGRDGSGGGPRRQKLYRAGGGVGDVTEVTYDLRLRNAPLYIKTMAEGIEVVDSHAILDCLEDPNDVMVQWHLLWVTAATAQLTGKAYWWLFDDPARDGRMTIWPMPPHWVRPNDDKQRYPGATWLVQPTGSTTDPMPVRKEDMCYFYYPDPLNPRSALSPLQTQATSVVIDEKIQQSQMATYDNAGRPGMILKAGRVKDQFGRPMDQRHVLTPQQRTQLVNAMKMAYSGVLKHGEPIIVDGLIEDVMPWTRTAMEMDYVDSERAKKGRIMQGFGVNPISAGEIEGANRASSAVADQHLCDNVVNPLAKMLSQTATRVIGKRPQFQQSAGGKLYIWIEDATAKDDDLELQKMQAAAEWGILRKDEAREFLGLPSLGKKDGGEEFIDMKPEPAAIPGMPGGAGSKKPPGAAGKKPPAAAGGQQQQSGRKPSTPAGRGAAAAATGDPAVTGGGSGGGRTSRRRGRR